MSKTVFHAQDPKDLIAVVPPILGFQPTDSLVMLTITAPQFHARIDLPATEEQWDGVAKALLEPCIRHEVQEVIFLIYSQDPDSEFAEFLDFAWNLCGIDVRESILVTADAYLAMSDRVWRTYDLAEHAITLQAAYADHAPMDDSREAMAERVRPGVTESLYGDGADLLSAGGITAEGLLRHTRQGRTLEDVGLTRVLKSMTDPDWWVDVASLAQQDDAQAMLALWTEVLRATVPGSKFAHIAAALTAYFAWWAGRGAIAWAAIDHADPSSPFVGTLSTALRTAANPHDWDPKSIVA